MYPVTPDMVRFWMQERQDAASEQRLSQAARAAAAVAQTCRVCASSVRRTVARALGIARTPSKATAAVCPQGCEA